MRSGADAVTKFTCADKGHWLGNSSYPRFTIIDTPGFGDNIRSGFIYIQYLYLFKIYNEVVLNVVFGILHQR